MGYLGRRRWRVRVGGTAAEFDEVRAAVGRVFEEAFASAAGVEARERGPLVVELPRERLEFRKAEQFVNGWWGRSSTSDFTVGDHAALLPVVAERVARSAEEAWADGVTPELRAPLRERFSFAAFAAAGDGPALCRDLEVALEQQLRAHPAPSAAFERAMLELKAAGHDLWCWVPDEEWGHDYVEPRVGAGLRVTRTADAEVEEVRVVFERSG